MTSQRPTAAPSDPAVVPAASPWDDAFRTPGWDEPQRRTIKRLSSEFSVATLCGPRDTDVMETTARDNCESSSSPVSL